MSGDLASVLTSVESLKGGKRHVYGIIVSFGATLGLVMGAFYLPSFAAQDQTEQCTWEGVPSSIDRSFGISCVEKCEKDCWKNGLLSTSGALGIFAGALLSSMSDKYGRKPVFVVGAYMAAGALIGGALSPEVYSYMVFRVLGGIGYGIAIAGYTLAVEFIAPESKAFAGSFIWIVWTAMVVCFSPIAYIILIVFASSWRVLHIVIALPILASGTATLLWVPESPAFLIQQGKIEEAVKAVEWLVRLDGNAGNNPRISLEAQEENVVQNTNDTKSSLWQTLSSLFSSKPCLGRPTWMCTLLMAFAWFSVAFAYFALSLGVGSLPGNLYVNFILIIAVEAPSYVFTSPLADHIGRRACLVSTLGFGGVFCVLVGIIQSTGGADSAIITCALIGKFAVSISFAVVYVYASELFPTEIRSSGSGFCSAAARAATMIAPFTEIIVGSEDSSYYALGIVAMASAVLGAMLPETKVTTDITPKESEFVSQEPSAEPIISETANALHAEDNLKVAA